MVISFEDKYVVFTRPFGFFHTIKIIKIGIVTLWSVSALFVLGVLFLARYHHHTHVFGGEIADLSEEVSSEPIHLQWLAIDPPGASLYQQDLEKTLFYVGKNSRPDADMHTIQYLVALKSAHQTKLIEPQGTIYLTYTPQGLRFSETEKPLFVKFKEENQKGLYYEAGMKVSQDKGGHIYEEHLSGVFPYQAAEALEHKNHQEAYVKSLQHALWRQPDRFYETYGGKSFDPLKGCHRLEWSLSQDIKSAKHLCFVKPQTLLIFKEGFWMLPEPEEETRYYPMAQVVSVTRERMEIKLWDVIGIDTQQVVLGPQQIQPLNIKMEEVLARPRQHRGDQISCKIGNKHVLLRPGDWLLHLDKQWKVLKTPEEIEKYLSLELEGELFVFEGLEKNQGTTVFKGRIFDTMREQMQTVNILITQVRRPHQRKEVLSKEESHLSKSQEPLALEGEQAETQKQHEVSKEK